ncbi:hypothetical protein A0X68_07965 [Campylobacter jejuni]|nr:hypothetical protein [Campylobacter jejuni]
MLTLGLKYCINHSVQSAQEYTARGLLIDISFSHENNQNIAKPLSKNEKLLPFIKAKIALRVSNPL